MAKNTMNAVECMAALRRLRYAYGKYKEAIMNQLRQSYIDGNGDVQCRGQDTKAAVDFASKRFANARQYFLKRKAECHAKEDSTG